MARRALFILWARLKFHAEAKNKNQSISLVALPLRTNGNVCIQQCDIWMARPVHSNAKGVPQKYTADNCFDTSMAMPWYTICLHTNGYMFTYQWQCLYAPMPLHTNDSAFAYQCLYCSHWCVQPLMCSDTAIGVSESICVCVRKVLPCLSVCVYFCGPAGLGVYSHCHWYKKALVHTVIVIWHCDMVP